MFSHDQVWRAIDKLAELNGLSASGLARSARLDPTSFNRSKRVSPEGRARWPSTESIAKILEATNTSPMKFASLLDGLEGELVKSVHLVKWSDLSSPKNFKEDGTLVDGLWERITFSDVNSEYVIAIEVTVESCQPFYREGDILIAAPGSKLRRGDILIYATHAGEVSYAVFQRSTVVGISVKDRLSEDIRMIHHDDIVWKGRILMVKYA